MLISVDFHKNLFYISRPNKPVERTSYCSRHPEQSLSPSAASLTVRSCDRRWGWQTGEPSRWRGGGKGRSRHLRPLTHFVCLHRLNIDWWEWLGPSPFPYTQGPYTGCIPMREEGGVPTLWTHVSLHSRKEGKSPFIIIIIIINRRAAAAAALSPNVLDSNGSRLFSVRPGEPVCSLFQCRFSLLVSCVVRRGTVTSAPAEIWNSTLR